MLYLATLLLLAPTALAATRIQLVTVGDNGAIKYSPDIITAPVGSEVEFQFFGPAHSVVQADFDAPCQPFNDGAGFYAGMQTTGSGPNVSFL
jgi:plastocyanin